VRRLKSLEPRLLKPVCPGLRLIKVLLHIGQLGFSQG